MLLVIIEDTLDRLYTRVFITFVGLPSRLLVPVEDLVQQQGIVSLHNMTESEALMTYSANEWGDQSDTRLRASNSLAEAKEKGEVAVNALVAFELAGSLDALPGRCDFNEHAFFLDSDRFVKRNEVSSLGLGGFLIKGETGIDLGGDTAGNDLEDLFSEFDKLQWPVSEGRYKVGFRERTKRSVAASTCSSMVRPLSLPYAIATLIRPAYAGLFAAASNNDGFVVASYRNMSQKLRYNQIDHL